MENLETFNLSRDDRGVLTATLDLPGASMNIFNEAVIRDLATLVGRIETDPDVKVVVVRSGKKSGFLAGADVNQIAGMRSAEEVESTIRFGQDLFDRIEKLSVPTVAVIHGPCLGGGLEFAMACRYRVARDDGSTKLGLPETQLGLIPGWGGTQRLPRLVGQAEALTMILQARNLSASKALKDGLVDRIAAPENLDATVEELVSEILNGKGPHRPSRGFVAALRDGTAIGKKVVRHFARQAIEKQGKNYPALEAAIRCVEEGIAHGHERGLAKEREEFAKLIFGPTARNLMGIFFQREQARKASTWSDVSSDLKIETVAVVGAGVMGAGIAQAALTSGYRVILKDITQEIADGGLQKVQKLTRDAARKGVFPEAQAEALLKNVTATADWEPVRDANLVVEAVVERMPIKQDVFRELDRILKPEAIIASNTSALAVSEMAKVTGRVGQVAGLHFFNPVHKMPLVEVVRSPGTNDATVAALVGVVRRLGKTPVVVAEGPGFLVNRILFPYLDESVRLVREGVPFEDIDREAKRFGMPMGPLELLDAVGLDVAFDVSATLLPLTTDASPTPPVFEAMIANKRLGTKSGHGFYRYKDGKRQEPDPIPEMNTDPLRIPEPTMFGDGLISGIQQRLMFPMINEAARCLGDGVVTEAWMVDLAMILGTGFAPFRGGPLRLVDQWGVAEVVARMEHLAELVGPRYKPCDKLTELRDSGDTFYPTGETEPQLQTAK